MAMVESNVNWKRVRKNQSIWDKTRGWFENQRVSAAYNSHDRSGKRYQPGGCCIITQGELALRSMKSGQDKRRLGRWAWTLFQGKDGVKLRMVSAYVPNKAQQYGVRKTYSQQQQVLLSQNIKTDPITLFWSDLWETIDEWIEEGNQLIIGGDWNCDTRDPSFVQPFVSRKLVPSITGRHGHDGPETYQRGSSPIDEIFISKNINVINCGYLPHGTNCSDHRPLYIDINKVSALGSKLPDIPYYQARRLKCQDPRVVNKYISELNEHLEKHNSYERVKVLHQHLTSPLSQAAREEYETLDRIREKAMIQAEKKCRKLRMGHVKWSPEIQKSRDRIEYFKASLSKARGTKVSSRFLLRLGQKCDANSRGMGIIELEKLTHDAYMQYKELKVKHVERRESFIEELAEAQSAIGKKKKAQILKDMLQTEKQRSTFRRISLLTGEKQNLGTTFVEAKDGNGQRYQITERQKMEIAIINENRKKYHQTETSCPFHHEPLKSHFGQYGEGPKSEDVAKGIYVPPSELDEYTTDFIKVCSQDKDIIEEGTAEFPRSQEEYEKSWSLMKEKTASRTLHFGHFKAGIQHKDISNLHYLMAEIPIRSGYSPDRWKKATNVMILKKAGLYSLEKLRTLILYEADFNHNNKFFGRSTMKQSLTKNKMAIEQYSVPGKKSIDHALNRRLVFDIVRYLKICLAMTSCDLKSCYDRIAHTPAFLALRRIGIAKEVIFSMMETIQNSEFYTRTAYGDSDITFGGQERGFIAKPQGTGQGNGAAPQIWAVVSSAMFEVMHKKGLGTKFQAPMSKAELKLCGFAFVDDSDIIATSGHQNKPDDTVSQMQRNINCWDGVARSTGGALAPDKSWWYLIHFDWSKGDPRYGDLSKVSNDQLHGRDKDGNILQLKYLESHVAQEMLGVFLAPDGSNTKQLEVFQEKMDKYSEMIRTGHLDRHEAWTALNLVAIKKLEYALPALTLSSKECKDLMWPLLQSLLPRSGINRYIKRDVLYAPIAYQGLGVQDIYLTQGINHIVDIVEHTWKNTLTGHFIKSSLECLRLETGLQGNLLSKDYYECQPYLLNKSWIENSWQFITDNDITVQDRTSDFNIRRKNDHILMEQALLLYLSPVEARSFNRCRIFLQALTLSDITRGDGLGISHNCWNGIKTPLTARYSYTWPLYEKPGTKDWKIWRRVLSHIYDCNDKGKFSDYKLSEWIIDDLKWNWYENLDKSHLYFVSPEGIWYQHDRVGRSHLSIRYSGNRVKLLRQPLEKIDRTTVYENKKYLFTEGVCAIQGTYHRPSKQQDTLSNFLVVEQVQSPNIQQILEDLSTGRARAVTDGSYDPISKLGSAAWIIESDNQEQHIAGSSFTYGPSYLQGSYRSEITGIAALLHVIKRLCDQHQIKSGSYTLGCDNINGLHRAINTSNQLHSPKQQQSDLLSYCCDIQHSTPLTINPQHVKAHQDDNVPYHQLDRLSQLNVRMDIAAKRALRLRKEKELSYPNSEPQSIVGFIPVYVNGHRIWDNLHKGIYHAIMKEKALDYWEEKGRLTSITRELIDWKVVDKGMKGMITTRRRFVSKWSSHQLGTGKNMTKWKYRPHGNCPFCLHPDEDAYHILTCNHAEALAEWYSQVDNFLTTLTSIGTCPVLLVTIRYDLIAWKLNNKEASLDLLTSTQKLVITEQRKIGWKNFLEGLYSKEWVKYHDNLFRKDRSRRTGLTWAAKAYRSGWSLIFNLWSFRNEKLHETERIADMEGSRELDASIRREWNIGIGSLPAIEFSYLLSGKLEQTIKRSIQHKRSWLAIIRQGRVLHEDPNLITDDGFMFNGALRSSLGLPPLSK